MISSRESLILIGYICVYDYCTVKSGTSHATPGSVRQHRVVHAPPVDEYEPEVKDTKDQNQLYDIVKRFGNARSNNNHMKELKA